MAKDRAQIRAYLAQCTARVHVATVANGTAFFVAPTILLTCAHVVKDEFGELLGNLEVAFKEGSAWKTVPVKAVLHQSHRQTDLAFLRLPLGSTEHSFVCLSSEIVPGDPVMSFGFPRDFPDGNESTFEYQGDTNSGLSALITLKNGNAEAGASGSPVLNERLRTVCGVLTWSRGLHNDLGGRLTPIDLAFQEWPELRIWAAAKRQDDSWYSQLPSSLWRAAEAAQRERVHRDELYQRDLTLPHPLHRHWNTFKTRMPWHLRVEQQLEQLVSKITRAQCKERTPPILPTINFSAPYDEIAGSLRQYLSAELPEWLRLGIDALVERRQADAGPKDSGLSSTRVMQEALSKQIALLISARNDLQKLAESVQQPHYDRCFLFLGALGSGKTHFLASLLSTVNGPPDERIWVLWLRSYQLSDDIGLALLREINRRTQVMWSSLAEFDNYMQHTCDACMWIVAVDDLQNMEELSRFLNRLSDFLAIHTQLHRLHWIFTMDHTEYGRVAGSNMLWRHYGFHLASHGDDPVNATERPAAIGPWIVLDELNRDAETGARIIKSERYKDSGVTLAPAVDLPQITLDERRQLFNPFVAWAFLDAYAKHKGAAPLNLHFLTFVELFWATLVPRIAADTEARKRVEAFVAFLTTYVLDRGHVDRVPSAMLESHLQEQAQGKVHLAEQSAHEVLEALIRGGLMRSVVSSEPELHDHVEFSFEAIWHWRLGRRARLEIDRAINDGRDLPQFLDHWFDKSRVDARIASGMMQFLLLLLDDELVGTEKEHKYAQIWQWAAQSDRAPKEAVWFAASLVSTNRRKVLVPLVLEHASRRPLIDAELFPVVYLISSLVENLPSGTSLGQLLFFLQPHYAQMQEAALGEYFIYTLGRGLWACDDVETIVQAMIPLDGCEQMQVHEQAARLSMDVLGEYTQNAASLVIPVLTFLRGLQQPDKHRLLQVHQHRSRYRRSVMNILCRSLTSSEGLGAYGVLASHLWYRASESGVHSAVASEMLREANFAIADWYRAQHPRPKYEFLKLVSRLADSEYLSEREASFFLIRHTERTFEKKAVRVDAVYHEVLLRLSADQKLKPLMIEYADFLKENAK